MWSSQTKGLVATDLPISAEPCAAPTATLKNPCSVQLCGVKITCAALAGQLNALSAGASIATLWIGMPSIVEVTVSPAKLIPGSMFPITMVLVMRSAVCDAAVGLPVKTASVRFIASRGVSNSVPATRC
jgi:hypothetical protein